MAHFKVILLVASSWVLFSCNRHLSDVVFDNNGRVYESEIFGNEFSETSPPVFFNSRNEVKFLNKYPFEKGGYALVGLLSESDPNDLQNELGEFFTDDINVLNEFKKSWTFSKESVKYASSYHYIICVTQNGNIVESFGVNLNNNVITSGNGYYYFDSKKLAQFKNQVKKPKADFRSFNSLSEGRDCFFRMIKDKNLLLAYYPVWMHYEGKFTFIFKSSDQKMDAEGIEKRVTSDIKKNLPHQPFQINLLTYSTIGEYEFEITCNKDLFDQFNLYPKEKDWEPFEVGLITYWKN